MLKILVPNSRGAWGFSVNGKPPIRNTFSTTRTRRDLARDLGAPGKPFDLDWLTDCFADRLAAAERDGHATDGEYPERRPAKVDESATPVRLRGRTQPASEARQFACFRDALTAEDLPPEPLIEWQGEGLAALDVDFHGLPAASRPTAEDLDRVAGRIEPSPVFYWLTHGRGVRCIYESRSPFTAAELAGAGFLSLRRLWPFAEGEIKSATRHPSGERDGAKCGPVREGAGTPNVDVLRQQLTGDLVSEHAINAWLETRGMKRGGRYPHSLCPIAPSDAGGRDPVTVREHGVHCHYCAGKMGRGFVSFHRLCGHQGTSLLGTMTRRRCHWGHAKHVFASLLDIEGELARQCYSAALKINDVDEATREAIFSRGGHIIRLDGYWANEDGHPYAGQIDAILAELPAFSSPALVAESKQTGAAERLGYPAVQPVWGARIASFYGGSRVPTVIFYPRSLQPDYMRAFRPRYVPKRSRDTKAAWRLIEEAFPGLNRAYARLLVAAKGCAEAEIALPPMIWVHGPTGAAKTATVQVAASICGDSVQEPVWHKDADKTRQGILAAKATGSFCVFNEVLKEGSDAGRKPLSTMNFLLNVTPTSTSHKLYVGAVPLGWIPAMVFTDTTLPQDVSEDAQLARRLTAVRLDSQVDWVTSLRATGVNAPGRLRTTDERYAEACNTVLSEVIDDFFREPTPFTEIAERLGFHSILDQERSTVTATLRAFFDAVCAAPSVTEARLGDGWKAIDRNHETPLARLWEELADPDRATSRVCSSQDWQKVLTAPAPVSFQVRNNGRKTLIRFVSDGRYNGDILPARGVEPLAGGADRLGDAIDGGYFAGLPCLSGRPLDAAPVSGGED